MARKAQLIVRNLDPDLVTALRARAARSGRSTEAEHRATRRLGVGPGAMLEWDEQGGTIVVRRAGRYSSPDIHRAVFSKAGPKARTIEQLKEGLRRYVARRRARR